MPEPTWPHPTHRLLAEAVIVGLVVFGLYAAIRPDASATLGRLYDDTVYLSVGKSIADGTGYRSVQLVGSPVHVKFPPFVPLLAAGAWTVFGSLAAVAAFMSWASIIATAVAAGVLWWFARRELSVRFGLAALFVLVPLLTERTMFYFIGPASEPWMLLGWSVALLLAAKVARLTNAGLAAGGANVALGITLALSILARAQAVAVVVGVLLGLAVMRVGKRALAQIVVAAAVPLGAWQLAHNAMMARGPLSPLPDQVTYTAWIPTNDIGAFVAFVGQMVRISIPVSWTNFATVFVGWSSSKTLILATVLIACGLIGAMLVMRRFPPLGLTILVTVAVLVIWPYVQDRLLTPLMPVFGLAGAYAVERALEHMPRLVRRLALGMAALLAIVITGLNTRVQLASASNTDPSLYKQGIDAIVGWVDANTRPDEHIMVPWGGTIYLRTGRQTSIPNPEEPAIGQSVFAQPHRFLAGRIAADSVDVVITWQRAPGRALRALRDLAEACPGLMTEAPRDSAAISTGLHFYRVQRDVPCLALFVSPEPAATRTGNKNAP